MQYKGSLYARSPGILIAGTYSTYEVLYFPGMEGIAAGNRVCIYQSCQSLPFEARILKPQVDDSNLPGCICAKRSDGGEIKLSIAVHDPPCFGTSKFGELTMTLGALELTAQILDKPLKYGDYLKITFGDPNCPEKRGFPIEAFTYPQTQFLIWAFAEYNVGHEKTFFGVEHPARLPIIADKIHRFLVNSASESQTGDEIVFDIVPVDKFRNPTRFTGKLGYHFTLNGGKSFDSNSIEINLSPYQKAQIKYKAQKPGILRLYVKSAEIHGGGFPIKITTDKPLVHRYWGDLHVHSFISDGYGLADEALDYTRNILGHQFTAHTEHDDGDNLIDISTGKSHWQIYLEAASKVNEPGVFTVLLAEEMSGRPPMAEGHRNMYVGDDDLKLLVQGVDFNSTPQLIEIAKSKKALLFPHCVMQRGGHGTDWAFHDEEVERLVEIYAGWGSSEKTDSFEPVVYFSPEVGAQPTQILSYSKESRSVISALNRGFHLGFVACSDEHSGRASNVTFYQEQKVGSRSLPRRSGTTCIMAMENTRKTLFANLYNRNCYGVTGENRMLVDFSVNGNPMGSIVTDSSSSREIAFSVSAMDEIEQIDIVRNGKDLVSFQPDSLDFTKTYTDHGQEKPEDYYYLRVTTRQKDRAWSSPVWLRNSK